MRRNIKRQMLRHDQATLAEDRRPFKRVPHLADVSRPRMPQQRASQVKPAGGRPNVRPMSSRNASQRKDVGRTLTRRWKFDVEHLQPVIETLAKGPSCDCLSQIAVRRGDRSDLCGELPCAAQSLVLAFLENAQELRLRRWTHFADFVKKQDSAGGKFDLPRLGLALSVNKCLYSRSASGTVLRDAGGHLRAKYAALVPVLTERSRRVWAATEARAIGYGGIAAVARATGIAESTIQRGLYDLDARESLPAARNRRPGGGRKRATDTDPTLLRDLDALVEPTAPGDPESPLRWTSKSARTLAVALEGLGHHVSHTLVADLLHALGYSLQSNAKTREGRQHPDRDAQFRYIAQAMRRGQRRRQPTISVDTKKKELVGDFKNGGRTWRPPKSPYRVRVHDVVIRATATRGGKAIPYGVYDLQRDEGWVSVGIDHDTASFAVHTIRRWWRVMGRPAYRRARSLLITADAGGSNGARFWKWELQRLAN